MILSRPILICLLLASQLGVTVLGQGWLVWCRGPQGRVALEAPHDSCHHDCGTAQPAAADRHATPDASSDHGDADSCTNPHDCEDIPADLAPDAARTEPDVPHAAPNPSAPLLALATPTASAAPAMARLIRGIPPERGRPPPAIAPWRTIRMLV